MNSHGRSTQTPNQNPKPAKETGRLRIIDQSPPPDHEEFKAAQSFGLRGRKRLLDKRRRSS